MKQKRPYSWIVPSPDQTERRQAALAAFVARNKARKGRGEDPPAAVPLPVEPRPKGPKLSGGAAVALTFDSEES